MIRVLVADDFPLAREGITTGLEADAEIEVVGHAADGDEAVQRGHQLRPDVIVLDLRMPGAGGMEALHRFRTQLPSVRVLVLTANDSADVLLDAVAAGAAGYLTKGATAQELCEAVVSVHRGNTVVSSSLTAHLPDEHAAGSRREPRPQLSERERSVVHLVSEGRTDKEIAEQLFVSVRTVQYELASIRRKTGLSRRSEIARWAVRHSLG